VLAGDIAQCLVAVVEQASRRFYRDLDTVHVQVERSVEQVRAVVRTEQQGIAAVNRRNASLEMAVESLRGSAASRSAEIEALRNRLQELRAAARAVSNA